VRRAIAAAALALVLALGGCSTGDEYPEATAQSLQEGVLAVSQASAAGDYAGASLALDDVAARLAAALQAGDITDERAREIAMAIELVRTDLQTLIAAQQPVVEEDTSPGKGPDKPKPGKKDDEKPGKGDKKP
jgi:hypothetical protein